MNVQFGRWNFDGKPALPEDFERVKSLLTSYGPDRGTGYHHDAVVILCHSFCTTEESRKEQQPCVLPTGAVLTWDGRLDNRRQLVRQLGNPLSIEHSDVSIVAAAYERWGSGCFAKLIGDWALSLWSPGERTLILAKDPVGTRHLYYVADQNGVSWSSILDPLVTLSGKTFRLDEEYIAGWLSFFPAAHLTPYVGIRSVSPATFVLLTDARHTVQKYWDFDPGLRIRYRTDEEYERHFQAVFAQSVERRLRSDTPVLAELSGGMDSSAIVCMADRVMAQGADDLPPRLDTLSYFNDSEPNWNERPYVLKVEEARGRSGYHIEIDAAVSFRFDFPPGAFAATPGAAGRHLTEARRQFLQCLVTQGNRVVLSGVGGDEVTGGVPTPMPELMDLLARVHLCTLAHQVKLWALNKRKPWFFLLAEAARRFLPPRLVGVPKQLRSANWLNATFAKRNRGALAGYPSRVSLAGPPPSFQERLSTLNGLRRQLASLALSCEPLHEKRYPFLDRDLLEFLFAIPPQQLLRPGQRRSLMRRALAGVVPEELLRRRRKAYVVRSPLAAIANDWAALCEATQRMVTSSLGIVDATGFRAVLEKARLGQQVQLVGLTRTLEIESWLRNALSLGIIDVPIPHRESGKVPRRKGFLSGASLTSAGRRCSPCKTQMERRCNK